MHLYTWFMIHWSVSSTPQHDRPRDLFDQLRQLWDDQSGGALNSGCWVFFTRLVPLGKLNSNGCETFLKMKQVTTPFGSSQEPSSLPKNSAIVESERHLPKLIFFWVTGEFRGVFIQIFPRTSLLVGQTSGCAADHWGWRSLGVGCPRMMNNGELNWKNMRKWWQTLKTYIDWYLWVIAYSWLSLNWQNDKPSR